MSRSDCDHWRSSVYVGRLDCDQRGSVSVGRRIVIIEVTIRRRSVINGGSVMRGAIKLGSLRLCSLTNDIRLYCVTAGYWAVSLPH